MKRRNIIVKAKFNSSWHKFGFLIIICIIIITSTSSVESKIHNINTNQLNPQLNDDSEAHVHDANATRELKITENPSGSNSADINPFINTNNNNNNNVRAAGDDQTGSSSNSDGITSTGCFTSSDSLSCCLQYTWPGTEKTLTLKPEDPTSNISRSCTDVKVDDPAAACFDPIVYSYSNSSNRPDPHLVREYCRDNSEPCFCLSATCLKYTLYNNDQDQSIINETHFCGTVTQTNNDELLSSGCYSESRGGRIYEICVCRGDHCNSANNYMKNRSLLLGFSQLLLLLLALLFNLN